MGFFSGIRRRIKKLIPKEIRPALPFIAAMAPIPGIGGLAQRGLADQFLKASIAKGLTDDEADLKDILRTGAIAATPQLIDAGIGKLAAGDGRLADYLKATKTLKDGTETISIADKVSSMANPELVSMGGAKLIGAQAATDFGIKQAELNEKAIEEYNASLLSRGMEDKAQRRSAIFSIFVNNGYDEDEVNVMLDKYGYADGGKVKGEMLKMSMSSKDYAKILEDLMKKKRKKKADGGRIGFDKGGIAMMIRDLMLAGMDKDKAAEIAEDYYSEDVEREKLSNLQSDLSTAKEGLEAAFGQPLGGRRPEPMRIIPGFASGGDVDEVMEFDEEIITPEYLMKEEGVPIQEQVSSPDKMDDLNQLSLDMFGRPVFELSEDEFEMLQDFASQQALKPGLIDEYRNYKYQMEEQGITPMSPRDYFRNEFGAARLGVKKGGKVIKIMPEGVLYKGKAKDYPGIKQLIKDMKKKGTRPKKAEGGLMSMGGKELDLRGGGFVPMGKKERADDVPARLSKNEFVMTADAVRAAGGGSVQQGADLMYDTMKKLEAQS